MKTTLPRFIGICGNPGAGKSTVQKILETDFGVHPIDDGEVLRHFAIENLGLSESDVYTQEGKKLYTEILGKNWQNREILGELGVQLEKMFGEHIMPYIACTRIKDIEGSFSFGSVRKTQGKYYRDRGGIVIEVINPLAGTSPYSFDKYDQSFITHHISNTGQRSFEDPARGLENLRQKVHALVEGLGSE